MMKTTLALALAAYSSLSAAAFQPVATVVSDPRTNAESVSGRTTPLFMAEDGGVRTLA